MPEYNISIYKIYFEDCDDFYIGSTKQKLCRRMLNHRKTMKEVNRKSKLYTLMREKQGIFKYVLIATHTVKSFDEQRMKEQEYIDKYKPTLNMLNSFSNIGLYTRGVIHEPLPPKPKWVYCNACDVNIKYDDLEYHKKQESHIWNYFEIDESLIQDIHKWREDERKRKYETERYQKRRFSAEDYHLWLWERAILSGQNPDIPIPFKFDETKNIMIIDYDGNECSKDMSNWYSLQKYYCPRCKDYFDNKHNHE